MERNEFQQIQYRECFSNDMLMRAENPVSSYSEDREGKVLDIGCGQSGYLIDLIDSDFTLFGIDRSSTQIELLLSRAKEISEDHGVETIVGDYPHTDLEGDTFHAIILSNVLHFMTLEECAEFTAHVKSQLDRKGLLVLTVHSSESAFERGNGNFKHFFTPDDIHSLFPKSEYEYLVTEKKRYKKNVINREFTEHWIRNWHHLNNRRDEMAIIKEVQNDNKANEWFDSLSYVLKKK